MPGEGHRAEAEFRGRADQSRQHADASGAVRTGARAARARHQAEAGLCRCALQSRHGRDRCLDRSSAPGKVSIAPCYFSRAHAEAIVGKGMVSVELRHHDEAAAKFAMALAIKPGSPRILAQRGRLIYELSAPATRRLRISRRRLRSRPSSNWPSGARRRPAS